MWRRSLRLALVLGALAVLAPSHAGAQAGRLVVGVAADPETLDPQMSASLPTWNVARNVFDSLLVRDLKTFGYRPGLAESHRVVNDTTWQFKLRRGVRFHDGEEFNAGAYKVNEGNPAY